METANEYLDGQGQNQDENKHTEQDQNNNGNIGREVDEEENEDSSGNGVKAKLDVQPQANDSGKEENQEGHWSAESIATPQSEDLPASDTGQPATNHNNLGTHTENYGGTSAED